MHRVISVVTIACLGLVGDRRSINPLVEMVSDRSLGLVSRFFAVDALGEVCDRWDRPWQAVIATGINYRIRIPSLISAGTGVIDGY